MLDTKEPRSVHTRLKPIESVKKRLDPNTKRQYDNAITAAERAVSLNPNGADAFAQLAYTLDFSDKSAQAVDFFKKAMRLNPILPSYYFQQLGHRFWHLNRYDEAIEAHKEAIRLSPASSLTWVLRLPIVQRTVRRKPKLQRRRCSG